MKKKRIRRRSRPREAEPELSLIFEKRVPQKREKVSSDFAFGRCFFKKIGIFLFLAPNRTAFSENFSYFNLENLCHLPQ